jgi:hypothetical protein
VEGELVDDDDLRAAGEDGLDVELGAGDAAVGDLGPGQDLQPFQLLGGVGAAVGLHQPDHDIRSPGAPAVGLAEHGVGLPDAGCGAQVDAQGPTGHGVHDRPGSARRIGAGCLRQRAVAPSRWVALVPSCTLPR